MSLIQFEKQNNVGILTINRPEALNALNDEVLAELDLTLGTIENDQDLRCVILTGAGEKSFVAGADIKEMLSFNAKAGLMLAKRGQRIFQRLSDLGAVSIAAVNGFALGGGMELALSCDFIIASEKAKLGLPEVGLGLIPGYGGTQRLARVVGLNNARRMVFSADMFTAAQALQMGLVSEVVAPEELMNKAKQIAATIASKSPSAIRLAKKAIVQGFDQELSEAMAVEAEYFSQTFDLGDQKEGVAAFVEKRKPNFKGD